MKINIYYGGRGLIDDPTLFVINKMQSVLEELHVEVERFNLYEQKNSITTLPQSLKTADGIILATTVEWHGIGGFMTQFLDACWLYGDKEKISKIYMCPIVMSTTYGEREGKLDLTVAWEILGGLPCSGICGYIAETSVFERSENYNTIIEKKAENMYRTINQKLESLPASNQAVKKMVSFTKTMDLTPQESEQLSVYASDDSYVRTQKEDLQELTSMFRDMMGYEEEGSDSREEYIKEFKEHFTPQSGINAVYRLNIEGKKKPLIIEINGPRNEYYYGNVEESDVDISISKETLDDIVYARMTFQRAFMGGLIKIKGDFKILRALDLLFTFMEDGQYV
ncbi:MAG: SCP2 sterol-binding domain-containing protein [Lachnospiraceae bacterium]|nr:SCP2 sterol-binding domain-containing protein [Lachnospiraceae bacterium]